MAKVFFDANAFIDFVEKRASFDEIDLAGHSLFISPLSIHIISYLYEYFMPEKKLESVHKTFTIMPLTQRIAINALNGPTPDFEDNVQLHSSSEGNCDFFLTNDKKLLKLKFFGKTEIASTLPLN